MFILPAEADDSAIAGVTDRITKVIGEGGGAVGTVDRWGRRRLAYEIDKQTEGCYVVAQFKADPAVITELERTLKLADEVIRFKVVVRAA
jgi:small subunit ribosomal protein S6